MSDGHGPASRESKARRQTKLRIHQRHCRARSALLVALLAKQRSAASPEERERWSLLARFVERLRNRRA